MLITFDVNLIVWLSPDRLNFRDFIGYDRNLKKALAFQNFIKKISIGSRMLIKKEFFYKS